MSVESYYRAHPVELVRQNTFPHEVLVIDGQGRSGKNMISVLLSTMDRVEKMRLDGLFDTIPRYYYLGKMSLDAAIVALRVEADEKLYNNMISREVNFRFDDYTGVFKQGKPWLYVKRLFQKPEQHAVERLARENPIFQNMTHDGLHLASLYFKAFGPRFKLVHVFRDPVGNIYEQNRRDFGTRIGTDPREFQLTYRWRDTVMPLLAMGVEEDYVVGNPLERLVLMVDRMFRLNLQGYADLDPAFRPQVFFIEFEHFAVDPHHYMPRLEEFVGDRFTARTPRMMRRERCPRVIDPTQRAQRIADIERQISSKYLDIFRSLIADYDARPWLR